MNVTNEFREVNAEELQTIAGGAEDNGAFLLQEMLASLKLMGEMLSNVSKTRSEISMTFARNARA